MKIKRNKRVERSRRMRATVITRENQVSPRSLKELKRNAYLSLRANMGVSIWRSKKAIALLERDVAARAERLQHLEETILTPLVHPQVVMIPLVLLPEEAVPPQLEQQEPSSEPEPVAAVTPESQTVEIPPRGPSEEEGRTNFQYVSAARRIRRRVLV